MTTTYNFLGKEYIFEAFLNSVDFAGFNTTSIIRDFLLITWFIKRFWLW